MTDEVKAAELLDEELNHVAGGVDLLGESCWEAVCRKDSSHIFNWRGEHYKGETADCTIAGCGGTVEATRQLY